MSDQEEPRKQARFWGQDPRFALIGDDHFPVLLTDYLVGDRYSEDLTEFDGYREQFVALAKRRLEAILVRKDVEEWEMETFHELSDVEMSGKTFTCTVGPAVAQVSEE